MFSINKFRSWRKSSSRRKSAYIPPTAAVTQPPVEQDTAPEETIQDGSDGLKSGESKIDVLFVQDTTASQSPYIQSAKSAIRTICDKIVANTNIFPNDIRFGLIAFRDHPPQDSTYVTKNFGFSSDIGVMQKNLASLMAQGGGDGPEAVTAALALALEMPWGEKATKMVVLITDAPPHGIGEANDGFESSPDQNDPLDVARQMAERGITLFMVACEPTLSTQYKNAVDFYAALTEITSGKMLPLTMARKLGDYIAGTAVETIETEDLIKEYEDQIVDNVYNKEKTLEEVMQEMHDTLKKKKVKINTMHVEEMYHEGPQSMHNKNTWKGSSSIMDGKKTVSHTHGTRMKSAFSSGHEPTSSLDVGDVTYDHTKHIVMKSVMRKSTVTSSGMTLKGASGKGSLLK